MFLMIVYYDVFYDLVGHDTLSKNILLSPNSIILCNRACKVTAVKNLFLANVLGQN